MKLIVGLGNPGKIYIDSKHNIGFSVVRAFGRLYKASFRREKNHFSLTAKCKIKNQDVMLAMPLTFMNLSGLAVRALVKKYKINLENLLVVYDDLDLELGRFKIRPRGSSGRHRGLESIIDYLGSEDFSRLRIGIGRPPPNVDASEYVLSAFTKKEKEQINKAIERACGCCLTWVTKGVTASMNIFNKRS